jgi:hypothetical protein
MLKAAAMYFSHAHIESAQPRHVQQTICTPVRRLVACVSMDFEIVGKIAHVETIASGTGIRERACSRRQYGHGRWRKIKGVVRLHLIDGTIRLARDSLV